MPHPNHIIILRVVVVVVFWVTVETERYGDTSVITVPQWEDYIALGTTMDEGEGTRPILLRLAVVTIDSYSIPLVVPKTGTRRPRSLGVDVFSLFFTEIVRGISRPAYSAGVPWDILAMSKRNATNVSRRTSTMVPPDRGTCFWGLIFSPGLCDGKKKS